MPGQVKVGGSWKSASGLSVKVGGQWKTGTSAFVKVGGVWKQWFASVITDTFARSSTVTGLGTSETGQSWNSLRGNWRVSGSNSALSDDAGSTYALTSVNFGSPDSTVQVEVTPGTGPAFWVTDSNNWWAAVSYVTSTTASTPYTYSCQSCVNTTCTGCSSYTCSCGNGSAPTYTCACGNGSPGSPAVAATGDTNNCLCPTSTAHGVDCGSTCTSCSGQCPGGGPAGCTGCYNVGPSRVCTGNCYYKDSNCACGNASPGSPAVPATADTMNCSCNNGTPGTSNCCCGYSYSCQSCTTTTCIGYTDVTTYTYWLRLLSSVGGTVSNPTSDINLGSTTSVLTTSPAAIRVTTLGNVITAKAYSNTNYATQLGSTLSYTPGSPTKGTSVGILKAPSTLQGSNVDSFSTTI